MLRFVGLLFFLFLFNGHFCSQQTEASVIYSVVMDSDDPTLSQQLGAMTGSTMSITFKDENFRQDMNMVMMKSSSIHNAKKKRGIMLVDLMGMKQAAHIDNIKNQASTATDTNTQIEVTGEVKKILDFDCNKVILTDSNGMEMIMYVTESLNAINNKNKYGSDQVKGFPLSIEIEMPQLTMKMVAIEIKNKVEKSAFSIKIPEEYKEISLDELLQSLGGMQ
ncbi:DUF4412 domain-containing protein [Flavobacteriales bacterium]|nr:DUF4412 domain-containing protein [Flavobacteriales bacterium]